jgi:hypothetical protein
MSTCIQLVTFRRNVKPLSSLSKIAQKSGCSLAATTHPQEEGIMSLRNVDNNLKFDKM